jgi:hypothetical protein
MTPESPPVAVAAALGLEPARSGLDEHAHAQQQTSAAPPSK